MWNSDDEQPSAITGEYPKGSSRGHQGVHPRDVRVGGEAVADMLDELLSFYIVC